MSVRLATGPVSWGVDFADAPGNPPWPQVLDGARAAGFTGLELGPVGYLPEDPMRLRAELDARGLAPVGGFVFAPLHERAERASVVRAARRAARLVAGAGGRHLVIIDLVTPERARAAGRQERAPALDRDGRRVLAQAVREVVAVAGAAGLEPAVHPHAGSYIEFADEIAAAAEWAPLCLDTGHAAYARLDPARLVDEHDGRIALVHLKDVDPAVLERGLGFWDAIAAGVFCPVGEGVVDFAAFAAALERAGYAGWATVEQDRRGGADPVADLIASRRALAGLGLA